jgi:hypothetical protein
VQPALFPPEAKTTDTLVPFNDARKK